MRTHGDRTRRGRSSVGGFMAAAGVGVATLLGAAAGARACSTCGCTSVAGNADALAAALAPAGMSNCGMAGMSMGPATQAEARSFDFAAAQAAAPAAQATNVYVYNFDFSTDSSGTSAIDPVIHVGDTVTWTWVSGFHSVTSVAGSAEAFNSGDQFDVGHTFSHTFTNVGTFNYYCDIHGFDAGGGNAGGMSGSITVLAAVPEPATLAGLVGFAGVGLRRRRR